MESCFSAIKEVLSPESRTRKSIERAVELSTTSLSQSATDIDDHLYDHNLVDAFAQEQERYYNIFQTWALS